MLSRSKAKRKGAAHYHHRDAAVPVFGAHAAHAAADLPHRRADDRGGYGPFLPGCGAVHDYYRKQDRYGPDQDQ